MVMSKNEARGVFATSAAFSVTLSGVRVCMWQYVSFGPIFVIVYCLCRLPT